MAATVSIPKTSYQVGESFTVSWSGFSGNVNVYVFKGSNKWVDVVTQYSGTSYNITIYSDWEIRSDYTIKVEQVSNTAIYAYSSTFSVSATSSGGLVAYYPFSGNANDESGTGNNGTVYGATLTTDRFGNTNSAYSFDGNNDYIQIPNSTSLSFSDNFTFNLWFNISQKKEQVFLSKSGDRTGLGFKGHSSGDIDIENGRCCSALHGISAGAANINEWHMLTVTHGSGMIKAYLDGILQSEETTSAFDLNPNMANVEIYVGMGPSGWYYVNGKIDDIRIYNRVLTESEIQELYGTASTAPSLISPSNNSTITNSDITFQWSSVANASSYEILVDNNSGFGSPELNETALTSTSRTITNHLPDNVYYWKVRAKLSDGSYTAWSDAWQFTYNLPVYSAPVWVPLYRMYNNTNKDHFYTTSAVQRDSAKSSGYSYEKIEAYISDRKFDDPNCGYLFRLYNPVSDIHFYTSSETEKDNKIIAGYSYEGIAGFVYTTAVEGTSPLYYLEKTADTDNFYTISKFEYDNAINNYGFISNGAMGYVSPSGLKNPIAQNRPQGNFAGIDTETGAFKPVSFTDLSLKGVGPQLVFTRYYNSNNLSELPLGPGWSHSLYSYILEDADRNVIIKWGDGTESYFTNDGNNNFTPDAGNFDTLVRVNDGMNDGYNLTTKDQTIYAFRKLSINIPSGSPFVPSVFLTYIEDKHSNRMNFSYTADTGLLYRVDDATGRNFSFEHDTSWRLKKVTDNSSNRSISFSYDGDGNMTTLIDAMGNTTTYAYNTDHILTGITFPEGNSITSTYDNQQRITGYSVGGTSLSFDYTNGTAISSSQGNMATYVHDSLYRVTEVKDASLKSVYVGYDTGNLLNLPKTVTDRNSNASTYSYDAKGNVATAVNALSQITTYTYDDKNNVTSVTDPRGYITYYNYDANKKNLTSIKLPMNGTTSYTYFSNGLVDTITDPNNHSVAYTYDSNGNPTTITDNALGTHVDFTYDNAGRLLSKTDQLSRTTNYTYDANDNLTNVLNADNKSAIYTYDKNNRLTSITDFGGKATTYTYNAMNLPATETDPTGKVHQYGYNTVGKLSTVTLPDSHIISYVYDANNRITAIKYDDVPKVSFTEYDANGNLKGMADDNGTTTFAYDVLNRISSSTNSLVGKTVSYEYDASGNRTKIIYPGNNPVSYSYDGDNRLTSVTDWLNGTTTYAYDNAGILKTTTNPNSTTAAYSYDPANKLIGLSNKKSNNTVISDYSFTLNAFGNPTQIVINEPITSALTAANISYAYDDTNKITSAGDITYTHDPEGNLIGTSTGNVYSFDYANRLTQATVGGQSTQYLYDGFGNRIARTKDGVQSRYVLDLNGDMSNVLAETDSGGTISSYYVYGNGLISKITSGGQRYKYHYDSIGNTIAITDSSENITEKYAYDEFGKALSVSETTPNSFRYVGKYGVMDEGNGLLFMRARYYDVENGRFLSKDPIGFEGGDLNLYAYVGGNPVNYIDAEGLKVAWSDFIDTVSNTVGYAEKATNAGSNFYKISSWQRKSFDFISATKAGNLAAVSDKLSFAGKMLTVGKVAYVPFDLFFSGLYGVEPDTRALESLLLSAKLIGVLYSPVGIAIDIAEGSYEFYSMERAAYKSFPRYGSKKNKK
ncbi:MAG: hypothetical protein HY754_11020 [Nitrospirae bacterium]|nr:hypothetical protein [Nitrospirota bacterium]